MMQFFDAARLAAFTKLLAQPDPPEMEKTPRRSILRCCGDPDRRVTRLPIILNGWLARRHMEVDGE